jgi:hypothetical protein
VLKNNRVRELKFWSRLGDERGLIVRRQIYGKRYFGLRLTIIVEVVSSEVNRVQQ